MGYGQMENEAEKLLNTILEIEKQKIVLFKRINTLYKKDETDLETHLFINFKMSEYIDLHKMAIREGNKLAKRYAASVKAIEDEKYFNIRDIFDSIVKTEERRFKILMKIGEMLYDEKKYISENSFVVLSKFLIYKGLCDLASEKVINLARNIGAIEDDIKVEKILRN
jgi:hypothetical protein